MNIGKNMDSVGIEPTTFHSACFKRCEAKIIPLDHKPVNFLFYPL